MTGRRRMAGGGTILRTGSTARPIRDDMERVNRQDPIGFFERFPAGPAPDDATTVRMNASPPTFDMLQVAAL